MSSAGLVPGLIDDPDDIPIGSPPIPQSMSFAAASQGPIRAYGLGRMRSSSAATSNKAVSAHEAAEYKYFFPTHNDKYHPRPRGPLESSILEPNYNLHFSSNNYTTINSNYNNNHNNFSNYNNSSAINNNNNNRRRTVMGLQSLVTTPNTTTTATNSATTSVTSTITNIRNNSIISEHQQQQQLPGEQRKQSIVDVPRRLVNRTSMEFLLTSAKDSEATIVSAGADAAVIAKGKDGQDEPEVRTPSTTSTTSRKGSSPFRGLRKDSETIPPDFSSVWDEEEGLQEMPASAGRQRRRPASVIVSPTDSRRKVDDWFEEHEIVRRGSKASIHDHRLSMPIVKMVDLDMALDDLDIDDADSDTDTIVDGKVPSRGTTPTIIELAEEPEPTKSKGKFRMQPEEILAAAPLGGGKRQHRKSLSLFPPNNKTIAETTSVSMPSSPSGSGFPSSRPVRPIAALPALSFQNNSRCYVEHKNKKDPENQLEIIPRTGGSKDPAPIPRPITAAAPPGSPFRQNFQVIPDSPYSPYAESFEDNAGEGSSRSAALAMFYNGQFGRPTSQPPVPRNQRQQQVPYVEMRHNGRRRQRSFSFENDRNSNRFSQITLPPTYEEAVNRNHVCYTGGPDSGSSTSLPGSGESEDEDDSFQRRGQTTPRRRFFARIFRSTSNSGNNSSRRRRRRDSNAAEGEQPPPYEEESANNGSNSSLDNIIGTEEPNFDCAACEIRHPFSKIIQAPACGCTYCRSCMKTKFQLSISHASVRPSNVSIPVLCCAAEIPPSVLEDTNLLSPEDTAEYLRLLNVRQKEQDHMIALQMSVVDEPYQTCPSANCGLPVEWSAGGGTVRISCYCGTEFCFSCGKVWGGFKGGCEGMCS